MLNNIIKFAFKKIMYVIIIFLSIFMKLNDWMVTSIHGNDFCSSPIILNTMTTMRSSTDYWRNKLCQAIHKITVISMDWMDLEL